jgi:hypothetical protein
MTPEGNAVLTSRTVRDWTAVACEKGGFLISPKGACTGAWADIAKVAPDGRVTLVAKLPNKDAILLDPVPSYDVVLARVGEYAGVKAKPNAARAPPPLREFTDAEWAQFKGQNKVAMFGGEKRFLSAKPRDLKKHPYGKSPGTISLADAGVRVIPRADWPKYLAAHKAANAGLRALLYDKLPCSDQDGTNYCWANGPANCGATLVYTTGRGSYLLSAASVGGPLTGYSNEGGWPADAIQFMAKYGIVRDSLWPNASINRAYASKPEVIADYPKHLVTSTIADLGASGSIFDEVATCVLLGCPVAVSHDWWGHAVMAVDLEQKNGTWYMVERNSWGMDYGDQGFFPLPEGRGSNHAGPDDAQVILSLGEKVVPSNPARLSLRRAGEKRLALAN